MGYSVYPVPSSGISVSDGNNAGWNLGESQWEQISEYKSATSVSSINISSIPQTYRSLCLRIVGMTVNTNDSVYLRINNDSTASTYSRFYKKMLGSTWGNADQHSQSRIQLTDNPVSSGSTFHTFLNFPNYTSTSAKTVYWESFYFTNSGQENIYGYATFRKGTTTDAITSLNFLTNATNMYFDSNAALSLVLYGVK